MSRQAYDMGSASFERDRAYEEKTRAYAPSHYKEDVTTYPPIPHSTVNLREMYWDLRDCLDRLKAMNHERGD
jgi:hypothetical protein